MLLVLFLKVSKWLMILKIKKTKNIQYSTTGSFQRKRLTGKRRLKVARSKMIL